MLWVVTDTHRYPQNLPPPRLIMSDQCSLHEAIKIICVLFTVCYFGLQILILFKCSSETEELELKASDTNGLISLSVAAHAAAWTFQAE